MLGLFLTLFSNTITYQSDFTYVSSSIEIQLDEVKTEKLSCIQYARQFVNIPYNTNAEDIKSNSTAIEGGAILFSYSNDDHIAIIVKFEGDGAWIKEANFEEPNKISKRFVSFGDKSIRGFYK